MDSRTFFYGFGRALYHVDAAYDGFAKESGVAPTLLWVLYALNDGKAHTQCEICVDWELPKSTVNTVISELRQGGYVELRPIKGKRREMNILLTEKGISYAAGLLGELYKREEEVYEALGGDCGVAIQLEKIAGLLRG